MNLPTRSALLTTSLVLMLVGATAAWQYRQLSSGYTALLGQQLQGLAQAAAADLDYKLAMHLATLSREARRGDAATFSDPGRRAPFLAHSGLRPMFDGIALIDVAGHILQAEPPPVAKEVSVADRDYFRRARDTGVAAVSQPLSARTSGESAVLMAVSVKDADGRVLGVLGGGLNLHRPNMLGNLAAARLGGEGYYIVDSGGESPVYVVHPDPARVLQPVRGGEADTEWRQPDDLESSAKIAATGWNVHVVLPARTAYAPLAKARRALLLQMLLLAVLTGILVWAGTLWLVRPLGSLHSVIRRLRRNPDAPVLLDVRANGEYGDLAREFDALMTELRTQRSEKAALTDAAPVGLFRCDERGRMVDVNDAYLAIHGIERAHAADGWLGCIRPAQREETWRQWLARVASNEPFQLKRWIRRSDGSSVLVSLQMQPIVAAGRVVGQVGTLIDITERTLAEQALRTQTAIFEKTTDYVVQLDKHGRLSYMNPAARQRTGVAQDAPVTHFTMADFMPPATLLRLRETIVPTAVSRGVWVGESDICGAHPADVFPVSHMVIAHRDKAGKIERFSGIMRDISEAKATEVALFESEARLRTIADALPMRVAFIDTSQRYRFVNRAYEGAFGIPREAIVGRTVKELFGSRFHSIEAHVARALQGEPVTFQSELVSDGGYACFESNYIPQRGIDGSVLTGFHAVSTDVTRQKQEEKRLLQLAHEDPLTGLANRAGFNRRLEETLAAAPGGGRVAALMFLDLDRFKQVNDQFGHGTGDALLREVADRLVQALRARDFVARVGGDEFTVIIGQVADAQTAARIAAKIVDALSRPYMLSGCRVDVSASVGVAFHVAGSAATATQLMLAADEMLYQAKGAGRNDYRLAEFPEARATA
ncbi:diguanylate cyclase [Variovorax sp. J31P207]|uniref:diguanylate cyclase domain-containing protein n=1 Tax=Variovorax sp. J31P207 TaxID=3053510 RepID=UPI0025785D19|nr:diguanylate cyclase [Variovorax sp. J31P207]MDM0066314.1 diguanylate cyclase [Variovorax sp. J31P207]